MMISTIELSGQEDIVPLVATIRGRSSVPPSTVSDVQRIIDAVRDRGDEAVAELTRSA
jgi:histidinol dehydrogenase